jgi:predicted permease
MLKLIAILFRLRYGRGAEFMIGDVIEEYQSKRRGLAWLASEWFSTFRPQTYVEREGRLFTSFWTDLRYAFRTLSKHPGFAAVSIAAIALGIGINTGIFSLLNAAAFRPLPVPDAQKITAVWQNIRGIDRSVSGEASMFSVDEYRTYRDSNQVFSGLIAYAPFIELTMGGERPRDIVGTYASCNYFDVLQVRPRLGRGFQPGDCAAVGSGAVAVLSEDLWRREFGGDPSIVGRAIVLNRHPVTIVGVAPSGFHGTEAFVSAFWVPLEMVPVLEKQTRARVYANANMSWLAMLGKRKDGVSSEQVAADLRVIAARIDQGQKGRSTSLSINTANLASMPEARQMVTGVGAVILVATGMVLLMVCANLANLLLARATARRREIAIRLSVGATRWRLVRQLMTENLLIAMAGGVFGSLLSFLTFEAILRLVLAHAPKGLPQFILNVTPDVRVLGYALGMTTVTGIAFGLIPALQGSKLGLSNAASERSGERWNGRLRGTLVGAQVAVCMVLLIAAGLLLRALYATQTVDPGFEMKNVWTATFHLRNQGYQDDTAAELQRRLIETILAIPGVDRVAQASNSPLNDNHTGSTFIPSGETQERELEFNTVSSEYLPMLNIPMIRGRNFKPGDKNVAIVTAWTAQQLWPGKDPIGQTLTDGDKHAIEVIGVTRDAQASHLGRSNEVFAYFPAQQDDQLFQQLLVHSAIPNASAIGSQIRAAIHAADPNLAVEVAPLEENLEWFRTPSRIVATLAGTMGAVGLLLAAIGIYGVVAFAVNRRTREIGIRMALGADNRSVVKMMLRQAMRPVAIGALIGIAGCAAVSQILSSMLFGVSAYDPAAFIGVPLFLLAIAMLASYIPARRATKIDPMSALRCE